MDKQESNTNLLKSQEVLENIRKISEILLYSYLLDLLVMQIPGLKNLTFAAEMAGVLLVYAVILRWKTLKNWVFNGRYLEIKISSLFCITIAAMVVARFLDYNNQEHNPEELIIAALSYLIGALAVFYKFKTSLLKYIQHNQAEIKYYYDISPAILARIASLMAAATQSPNDYPLFLIAALCIHFSDKEPDELRRI